MCNISIVNAIKRLFWERPPQRESLKRSTQVTKCSSVLCRFGSWFPESMSSHDWTETDSVFDKLMLKLWLESHISDSSTQCAWSKYFPSAYLILLLLTPHLSSFVSRGTLAVYLNIYLSWVCCRDSINNKLFHIWGTFWILNRMKS